MTSVPAPNYDAFDELAPEHLQTLADFSDLDARPDYVLGQGHLDSVHLALTHLGVKPACFFAFGRTTADPEAPHDCPMRAAIEAMGLHYVKTTEVTTPDEYWGGALVDEFEDGEVRVGYEYFVAHDKADVDWFEEADYEVNRQQYDLRMGAALGYPKAAVEAHADPDVPSDTDDAAEFILNTFDEYDLDDLRYRDLAPFIPARTVESVKRSIEYGRKYKEAIDGLVERYEVLEPLKSRFDGSLSTAEEYERYLRYLTDDTYECDPDAFEALSEAALARLEAFGTRDGIAADYAYTDYDIVNLVLTLGRSLPAYSFVMGTPHDAEVTPLLEPALSEFDLDYRVVDDRRDGVVIRQRYVLGEDAEWVNWAADEFERGATPDPARFRRGLGWPEAAIDAFETGAPCVLPTAYFELVDGEIEYRDDVDVSDEYGNLSFVPYSVPDADEDLDEALFNGSLIRRECWTLGNVDGLEWFRDPPERLYPAPREL